jgi:glucokinase
VLSFDLGGTNVRCAVVDDEGRILARARTTTGERPGPEEVVRKMGQISREAIGQSGVGRSAIPCAGIGSPGPLNSRSGIIFETPNLGWTNVPLAKMLAEELKLPAFLENDAVAACWGEYWKGAGQGVKSMFILTLGTGVGGGLILDGKVWRGPDDTAGHLGHMVVDPDGPIQNLDNPGSVEALCSATACVRDARAAARAHPESLLAKVPPEQITALYVNQCADRGDFCAQEIYRRIGCHLGIACASLANALNPELGVIAGGMAAAGDRIMGPLRKECSRRALQVPGRRLKVVFAQLGDDAGTIGAAGLALERLKEQAA